MEQREFPRYRFQDEPSDFGSGLKPKVSEFTRKFLIFTKFVLGLCLIPFVYTFTGAFLSEFSHIEKPLQEYFWWGIVSFLVVYLFIWEPVKLYTTGQKLLELFFHFFKPLVRVAPYLLPVYTILLLIVYGAFSWALEGLSGYFAFLFGFTLCLHLVFSAKTMRAKKDDFFKANYIFGFSLIYLINIIFLSFFLSIIFKEFSFVSLCKNAYQIGQDIYNAIATQLFVNK